MVPPAVVSATQDIMTATEQTETEQTETEAETEAGQNMQVGVNRFLQL